MPDNLLNLLYYALCCFYSMLPGIAANAAPLIVKKLNINILDFPVDFNLKFNGSYIFGPNKTYRGVLSGILFSLIIIIIQYLLCGFDFFKSLELIDFDKVNFAAAGLLIGSGVMIGDIIKSFVKRRLNIQPGNSFMPWDQIDCGIGGLLFLRLVWAYDLIFFIFIVVITFFIHLTGRFIAYHLKLTDSKL